MDRIANSENRLIKRRKTLEMKEKVLKGDGDRVREGLKKSGVIREKRLAPGDSFKETAGRANRAGVEKAGAGPRACVETVGAGPCPERRVSANGSVRRELNEKSDRPHKHITEHSGDKHSEILLRKIKTTPESVKNEWNRKQLESSHFKPEEVERLRSIPEVRNTVERIPEAKRREMAIKSIKEIESIKPEKWRNLDETGRRVSLSLVGDALRRAYECSDPPLYTRNLPCSNGMTLRGYEVDGADIRHPERDYNISLNKQLLLNDDPSVALETYCHEFRHSYQNEMAGRYKKPQFENLVHNIEDARKWSLNLDHYRGGPPPEMKPGSPEFTRAIREYSEQLVEKDAREFSQDIVRRVLGWNSERFLRGPS